MALFTPPAYWGGASVPPPAFDPSFLGTSLHHWISMNAGSISTNFNILSLTDLGSYNGGWNVGGSTGNSYAKRSTTSAITYNGSNAAYARMDGGSDYWSTSVFSTITDSSGNTYIVMLCDIRNVGNKFASLISLQGVRDFQIESADPTTWLGNFDMDGLSSSNVLPWFSDNGTTRNYTLQYNIFAFVFNKTGNQIYGRINGYPLSNTISYSNSMTNGNFKIASNRGGNRRLFMDTVETLVIKDKPGNATNTSIETLEKVEGWIAWTYGLEGNLIPSHPYKNAAP